MLPPRLFARLAGEYRHAWGAELLVSACDGTPIPGYGAQGTPCAVRALAISEPMRWGEPVVLHREDAFIWAVPILVNQQLLGGLIASLSEGVAFPGGWGKSVVDVRAACRDLLVRAIDLNVTNSARLEAIGREHEREGERAEAIQTAKSDHARDALAEYRRAEPELLNAVHNNDRAGAREILNRVLAGICKRDKARPALAKSLLMELVVVLCQAAIEAGGRQDELLVVRWYMLSELKDTDGEAALGRWLMAAFDRIMDLLKCHRADPADVAARQVIEHMRQHCAEDLDREQVAVQAGLSPAALSRLLLRRQGKGFTDTLNQMRIDRAKRLLERENPSLLNIALACGFEDPSYFTKVFRRHEGLTPSEYSRRARARD